MVDNLDAAPPGLGTEPRSEWPRPPAPDAAARPIQLLKPQSELHDRVRDYLVVRLESSEEEMTKFHSRWQSMEKKVQAYIDLTDYEKLLDEMNKQGKPPQAVSITLPYSYATIATIVTYLAHTFCGRRPIFQVGNYRGEVVSNAQSMETLLQYNSDHTRLVAKIFQFLLDTQIYGYGVLRPNWMREKQMRTVRSQLPIYNFFNSIVGRRPIAQRVERVIYQGNTVENQDPYMFFPDPRVPMTAVNKRGEFVFWRNYEGRHILKRLEAQGIFSYIDAASRTLPQTRFAGNSQQSVRHLKAMGQSHPGEGITSRARISDYYQIDQGTVDIIPAELGLSRSDKPEKWIFALANKHQVIQAEPFDADHGMHPVCISEPYGLGYGFGQAGISDYIGPLQDLVSWLVNSHIYNVRAALNNMFVVDPSMVEMKDVRNPAAGKLIRLKRAAYGQDVRQALTQLAVADVTGTHMQDLEKFMRVGQILTAVTENVMGLQDAGGRKTATEVRTAGEAAASRLAAQARLISAQAFVDLATQMSLNIQQYMDEQFEMQVLGSDGKLASVKIAPDQLVGDFHFPIHDGTLPLDRVAMLDIWKEILLGVVKDPLLRQSYSVPKIFEFVAELGGARNIESMRLNIRPDAQVQAAAAAGNAVPLNGGALTAPGANGMVQS